MRDAVCVSCNSLRRLGIVVALGLTLAAGRASPSPTFVGIGRLGDAPAISADGVVVVGQDAGSGLAVRWGAESGLVALGDFGGGSSSSKAWGVSADGSVVVGQGHPAVGEEAFRWAGEGMLGLGDLPGGAVNSDARGVSADGLTVVGIGSSNHPDRPLSMREAFRWTAADGMVGLGTAPCPVQLPEDCTRGSEAHGVSADGAVTVGSTTNSDLGRRAVRWTQDGTMRFLGELPPGSRSPESEARAVSANSIVVVGSSMSGAIEAEEAVRWTQEGGIFGLGQLVEEAGFYSRALAVSGDGAVVVGTAAGTGQQDEAFIWDTENGMRALHQVLSSLGLEVSGWELIGATGVSADGKTIVGYGKAPWNTGPAAVDVWIATIPEPHTALLLGMGLAMLAGARRARIGSPRRR